MEQHELKLIEALLEPMVVRIIEKAVAAHRTLNEIDEKAMRAVAIECMHSPSLEGFIRDVIRDEANHFRDPPQGSKF